MKNRVVRFRVADRNSFLDVRRGLKTVETRAATERYRSILPGDTITFTCGKSRFKKRVQRVRLFTSVGSMARQIPFRRIMPRVHSVGEMREACARYPGYRKKIRKYGIVAMEIR